VEGIRQAKLPIAKYLFEMPPFDPGHPDPVSKFDIPAEPARPMRSGLTANSAPEDRPVYFKSPKCTASGTLGSSSN
jgi:hypothetical protein